MARLLYRVFRMANLVGSFDETKLRAIYNAPSFLESLSRIAELDKPLSYALPMTGNAMSPLFNSHLSCSEQNQNEKSSDGDNSRQSQPDGRNRPRSPAHRAKDTLVIRRLNSIPQSFFNRLHVNDIVVVQDPEDSRRKYVRRIAALEGAELVSDVEGDEPFRVPANHCWVLRENLAALAAPDSTYFGPISLKYIVGRVMYAIRSRTDHGRVTNSPYSTASDAIVLAQEPVLPYVDAHGEQAKGSPNPRSTGQG